MTQFKAGDVVEAREDFGSWLTAGKQYTVRSTDERFVDVKGDNGANGGFYPYMFKLVTSATTTAVLPTDSATRKNIPIATGVLGYFPLATAYVSLVSKVGNDQHNPGQPLHWAREKSTDHADCIARHLIDRGTVDTDKLRHSGKLAWRALANLQVELEAAIARGEDPFSLAGDGK